MSKFQSVLSATLSAAKKGGVIPDVLESISNTAVVNASYGSKVVKDGNELLVAETQDVPKVEVAVPSISESSTYTLVVTDPDAPRRGDKKWSEYLHFLATDIKLDPKLSGELQTLNLSAAKDLHSYQGPAPPESTSLHRYVFVLLEGSSSQAPTDRIKWGYEAPGSGLKDWIKGQDLKPIGLNYFVAQNVKQD